MLLTVVGYAWQIVGILLYLQNRNRVASSSHHQDVDRNLLILISIVGILFNGLYGLGFAVVSMLVAHRLLGVTYNSPEE